MFRFNMYSCLGSYMQGWEDEVGTENDGCKCKCGDKCTCNPCTCKWNMDDTPSIYSPFSRYEWNKLLTINLLWIWNSNFSSFLMLLGLWWYDEVTIYHSQIIIVALVLLWVFLYKRSNNVCKYHFLNGRILCIYHLWVWVCFCISLPFWNSSMRADLFDHCLIFFELNVYRWLKFH